MLLSVELPEFVLEELLDVPIDDPVSELVPALPADHAGVMLRHVPANKIADNDRYFLFIRKPLSVI